MRVRVPSAGPVSSLYANSIQAPVASKVHLIETSIEVGKESAWSLYAGKFYGPRRLMARTSVFQAEEDGSKPFGATSFGLSTA